MKKAFTIITILLVCNLSAQIQVQTSEAWERIGKTQGIKLERLDDTYRFTYDDAKYTQVSNFKSFQFQDVDGAMNELYHTIAEGFNEMPTESILIDLPQGSITLEYKKVFGTINLQIYHALDDEASVIGLTPYLTRRKVEKLFGKR